MASQLIGTTETGWFNPGVNPPPFDMKLLLMVAGSRSEDCGRTFEPYTVVMTAYVQQQGPGDEYDDEPAFDEYMSGDQSDFLEFQFNLKDEDGEVLDWYSDSIVAWAYYPLGIAQTAVNVERERQAALVPNAKVTGAEPALSAGVRVDRRVMRLAALFVQPDGCYAGLPDVDAWPEARDARNYTGPLPVVAHPPCQLWGAMANVNYTRWGGEHNKPGNDGGCFAAALESVRRFGGVLEHPAKTKAWAAHGLAQPAGIGWQRAIDGGWVCEVWQSAYGHRANKATWLYYHGTNPPFELRWARPKGTHQIGFHDQRGKAANKPTLGKREANATPLEFRDELLRLAMMAHNG